MEPADAVQADIMQAFQNMSDGEAAAWVAGGDYASVAGLRLPDTVPEQLAELLSNDDTEGFAFDANPLGSTPLASPGNQGAYLADIFKNCCAGAHYKTVTLEMRKSGGDPKSSGKPF